MTQKLGLTKRQGQYLDWIIDYIKENNQSPSKEDIGKGMGTSTNAAQKVCKSLIERGHLVDIPNTPRSLALPE